MGVRHLGMGLVALCGGMILQGTALAQDAPAQQAAPEVLAPAAPAGPDWWIFSRSSDRTYLIDVTRIVRTGDELTVNVARVPRSGDTADYSHAEDRFGVRCGAAETQVALSADIFEDGEPTEPYVTDEPWEAVRPGSVDEGVKVIACENRRPPGPSYPSVKAYIDAGRP